MTSPVYTTHNKMAEAPLCCVTSLQLAVCPGHRGEAVLGYHTSVSLQIPPAAATHSVPVTAITVRAWPPYASSRISREIIGDTFLCMGFYALAGFPE